MIPLEEHVIFKINNPCSTSFSTFSISFEEKLKHSRKSQKLENALGEKAELISIPLGANGLKNKLHVNEKFLCCKFDLWTYIVLLS